MSADEDYLTCRGYKRPAHEARYIYDHGYCPMCRDHRDSDAERAELGRAAGWDDATRRGAL